MYPRLRLDITWNDLARAVGYCLGSHGNAPLPAAGHEALVALSVRSAFDLLLGALDLPPGSQVLLSEITVPHMPRIAEERGLTVASVPVDPRTLAVDAEEVARRLTPQTKVLVVAHLFGTRMPLAILGQLCRERGVLLVEDCAQALVSGSPVRDTAADVSLYSFGPIKTATALGGAIALVRDKQLRARMSDMANQWPQQKSTSYLGRLAKVAGLKLLASRPLFSLLVRLVDLAGGDADAFVGHSARGFPDEELFHHLRQQPCVALARLLAWRLAHFDVSQIAERSRRGRQLAEALQCTAVVAGCDNSTHTYWVFPLVCEHPGRVVATLRRGGFDASQISGLTVVDNDAPDHWFRHTVFVPHGCQVPARCLPRIAELVGQAK